MDAKRLKYTPLGEFLCAETAMIQAARSLDIAGYVAAELRDADAMMKVGLAWAEIATNMTSGEGPEEDEEHEHEHKESEKPESPKKVVGFSGSRS